MSVYGWLRAVERPMQQGQLQCVECNGAALAAAPGVSSGGIGKTRNFLKWRRDAWQWRQQQQRRGAAIAPATATGAAPSGPCCCCSSASCSLSCASARSSCCGSNSSSRCSAAAAPVLCFFGTRRKTAGIVGSRSSSGAARGCAVWCSSRKNTAAVASAGRSRAGVRLCLCARKGGVPALRYSSLPGSPCRNRRRAGTDAAAPAVGEAGSTSALFLSSCSNGKSSRGPFAYAAASRNVRGTVLQQGRGVKSCRPPVASAAGCAAAAAARTCLREKSSSSSRGPRVLLSPSSHSSSSSRRRDCSSSNSSDSSSSERYVSSPAAAAAYRHRQREARAASAGCTDAATAVSCCSSGSACSSSRQLQQTAAAAAGRRRRANSTSRFRKGERTFQRRSSGGTLHQGSRDAAIASRRAVSAAPPPPLRRRPARRAAAAPERRGRAAGGGGRRAAPGVRLSTRKVRIGHASASAAARSATAGAGVGRAAATAVILGRAGEGPAAAARIRQQRLAAAAPAARLVGTRTGHALSQRTKDRAAARVCIRIKEEAAAGQGGRKRKAEAAAAVPFKRGDSETVSVPRCSSSSGSNHKRSLCTSSSRNREEAGVLHEQQLLHAHLVRPSRAATKAEGATAFPSLSSPAKRRRMDTAVACGTNSRSSNSSRSSSRSRSSSTPSPSKERGGSHGGGSWRGCSSCGARLRSVAAGTSSSNASSPSAVFSSCGSCCSSAGASAGGGRVGRKSGKTGGGGRWQQQHQQEGHQQSREDATTTGVRKQLQQQQKGKRRKAAATAEEDGESEAEEHENENEEPTAKKQKKSWRRRPRQQQTQHSRIYSDDAATSEEGEEDEEEEEGEGGAEEEVGETTGKDDDEDEENENENEDEEEGHEGAEEEDAEDDDDDEGEDEAEDEEGAKEGKKKGEDAAMGSGNEESTEDCGSRYDSDDEEEEEEEDEEEDAEEDRECRKQEIANNVVKVYCTHCWPSFSYPWSTRGQTQSTSTGTVFDINERLLLSNAHSVESAAVVQVRKRGDHMKYEAKVLCVGHDCDLSLLTVEDDAFWEDLSAVAWGEAPKLEDPVTVVGYPVGGDNTSVTQGVVSRIDFQRYSQGGCNLLAIQIDAAINGGNSGGPAFNRHRQCVGVAFQSLKDGETENIGYIIPREVVFHFMEDWKKNRRYTGFGSCNLIWQPLENKHMQQCLGVKERGCGVLVSKVDKTSCADAYLKKGDILLSIEGQTIATDGTVPFENGERITFEWLLCKKFAGESCRLTILRNRREKEVELPVRRSEARMCEARIAFGLRHMLSLMQQLVPAYLPEKQKPQYFIAGGVVFVPLSELFMAAEYAQECWCHAPVALFAAWHRTYKNFPAEQVVVVGHVLAHEITVGYEDFAHHCVLEFNGEKVKNLRHLSHMVEQSQDDYWRFDLDSDLVMILHAESARAALDDILKQNMIPSHKSDFL